MGVTSLADRYSSYSGLGIVCQRPVSFMIECKQIRTKDRSKMENNAKAVAKFHEDRRMFAFIDGEVIIAPPSIPKSHEEWLKSLGYSGDEMRLVMENNLRGYIDSVGDIYLYRGNDFCFDEADESQVPEIVRALNEAISWSSVAKIYGGVVRGQPGKKWPGEREIGKIGDFLVL